MLDGLALGRRRVRGVTFVYRRDTVDEIVLGAAYRRRRCPIPSLPRGQSAVIVDAGAHIGAYACIVARVLPQATVYALEPEETNFELLQRNIRSNGLGNVVPLRVALAGSNGVRPLLRAAENWAHAIGTGGAPYPPGAARVRCRTLEALMSDHRLARIDVLKMNIEGAEYEVLLPAPGALLRRIHRLGVETHPSRDNLSAQMVARLRDCGFRVVVSSSTEEPGKGWMTAVLQR